MAKKILVVDDEEDILKILPLGLKQQGYEVITAMNSSEALSQLSQGLPDLIILDIMLPGMTGAELATHLKKNTLTANIPVIFLSALQTKEEEKKQGTSTTGNVILAKPYEISSLIARIEQMTG